MVCGPVHRGHGSSGPRGAAPHAAIRGGGGGVDPERPAGAAQSAAPGRRGAGPRSVAQRGDRGEGTVVSGSSGR